MYKIKGFLYDVARGLQGDINYIEQLMIRLAGYEYNMLILQLEYRFQFPSHPAIGTNDSLKPEDIKYLGQIADKLNIELVPCVNCAGHFEGIGLLEKYKHLSVDSSGITGGAVEQLKVGEPEAISLVKDMYNDLFGCFNSKYFHIGGDEIRHLKAQMPDLSEEESCLIAKEHLLTIINFVIDNGKIPMMWGDMLLNHEEIFSNIPSDVIICDWEYYDVPKRSGPGRIDSQVLFKNSGKQVLACPAVNGFYGNPIVAINSTENIKAFTQDNKAIKGDGVLLCTWEVDFGNFFSAHWPWIYYASECLKDREIDGMDFLREYTNKEWGLDTDDLKTWYEAVDIEVQKILEQYSDRPFMLIRGLRHQVFRTKNLLAVIYDSRSWLNNKVRADIRTSLQRAKAIAKKMCDKTTVRKEEPLRLLEWTETFLCILEIADLIEELEYHYHEAAIVQRIDHEIFLKKISECIAIIDKIYKSTEILKKWTKILVDYENQAEEEMWWVPQAQCNIKMKAQELDTSKANNRSLINFNLFIHRDPGIPNRVMNR